MVQQLSKHAAALPYISVMAKTSAFMDAGDARRALELGAVAVPLVSLAASGLSAAYQKMTAASRKATAYKSMLTENPHLHDRDATDVQRYFNTLYRLNPDLAHDPTVAASFVNNMAAMNRPDMPHAPLYEQARALAGQNRSNAGPSFGATAADTIWRLGESVKKDRTDKMKEDFRTQIDSVKGDISTLGGQLRDADTRNRTLKAYAQKMKQKAQQSGGYYAP